MTQNQKELLKQYKTKYAVFEKEDDALDKEYNDLESDIDHWKDELKEAAQTIASRTKKIKLATERLQQIKIRTKQVERELDFYLDKIRELE